MTKTILIPTLIAATFLSACAQRKHAGTVKAAPAQAEASTKEGEATATPAVEVKAEAKTEAPAEVKAEGTQVSEAKPAVEAPKQKRVNAIGPDGKCTQEFMTEYPKYAADFTSKVVTLNKELAKMTKLVQAQDDSSAQATPLLQAYQSVAASYADMKNTFFPYACTTDGFDMAKLTFSSDKIETEYKKLYDLVRPNLGAPKMGPKL